MNLIQLTTSLEILSFAAAQRQLGCPSWVPDWSAYPRHQWIYKHGRPGVDQRGYALLNADVAALKRDSENPEQVLSIDQTEAILTVLARDLGAIETCLSFHRTSDTYNDSEKHLHFANLLSLALCVRTNGFDMSSFLDLAIVGEGRPSDTDMEVVRQRLGRGEDVESTFPLLAQRQSFSRFCNLLAGSKCTVCRASLTGFGEKAWLTACAPHTRKGDRILRILGLPRPLVVRELHGLNNSVEIVGPLTIPENRYGWPETIQGMFPVRYDFFRYHIH